ncbi:hypothetical protein N7532_000972 [Penicillium argentinense]|uniref:BHLH domain-containing protein n=1 Tax=Penicillium argentinense TaxID=1131581 RepID=A0A9W9G350_9EURO|nr:uncharacterized protein N7532_000972 [Penicillium argentinense]KAJ5110437.1 hypothetical protein N7532_000972 [Penicillium argentinense]
MCIPPISTMAAFSRPNPMSTLTAEDERYLNQQISPQSRPMDLYGSKASDPLPVNWAYDSGIDLFSVNPADMDPTAFDFSEMTNADTKDLFMDPFGTPTGISGFTMPTADDAVSPTSELDSDDQTWSTGARPSVDLALSEPAMESNKPVTRNASQSSSARWSSSPNIKTEEDYPVPRVTRKQSASTGRKTRSLSQDSRHSSTSQDPQTRNAAKRAAHNIIEKRYRTNMNAKFLSLEKAISPAGVHKQTARAGTASLKKSEILTNALTYIENVQHENQALHKELALLKQNLLPGGIWRHAKQSRV